MEKWKNSNKTIVWQNHFFVSKLRKVHNKIFFYCNTCVFVLFICVYILVFKIAKRMRFEQMVSYIIYMYMNYIVFTLTLGLETLQSWNVKRYRWYSLFYSRKCVTISCSIHVDKLIMFKRCWGWKIKGWSGTKARSIVWSDQTRKMKGWLPCAIIFLIYIKGSLKQVEEQPSPLPGPPAYPVATCLIVSQNRGDT